jgi:hypothetical protein
MMRGAELNVGKDGLEISWWWAGRITLIVEFAGHLDNRAIARLALRASDICSMEAQNIRLELTGPADDAALAGRQGHAGRSRRIGVLIFG